MYTYRAKLIRVIDGDTIDAIIDLGFDVWVKKRIRLNGIDAPETRTKNLTEKEHGLKAKAFLKEIMGSPDDPFVLQSHGVGKYGRCLGTIFKNDVNICHKLVNEGYAEEYKK
tara:strand:- start:191 stop:526 length:336 start_codon:yes stop_codon:yes gene_type:complete